MPSSTSAYGQHSPASCATSAMPTTPPTSAMSTGTAKLRITMDSSSCSATTASAPSSPRSMYSAICTGGQPARPQTALPHSTYSANTQPCVSSVTASTAAPFAAKKQKGCTGMVMSRFMPPPMCSIRHRYAAYTPTIGEKKNSA